ncbi:TPR repeat region-containing protein [Thermobifida cellulosilytica]|uniref:TPR repeat domain-containing protein n=1 Tax=Thermobifida cellulosilytica TB100 TaxID=665004 RepID=A0A147KIN5_THECS|nr:hypothetical protein [Thermobifida cellulosilytica]KUP97069.1 hypothetical protein AC529_08835 [Thermobifida cellulosilytica TB100]
MGIDLFFDPADIDADGGSVRGWASSLDMFCARILGNSEDLSAQFDDSAKEFDEITGWNLEGASEEDRQAWRDAAGAVRYCAAVTERWADDIDEFKRERNRLIGLWRDEKQDAEARIAALDDANWFSSLFSADKDQIVAELKDRLDELNAQARTNWDTLMDHADDRRRELTDGPTPANIRSLIDAGYVNWSLFNIDPVRYAPEISPHEADEWGQKLSEAWKTGRRGEEYDNLMMMLTMLSAKVLDSEKRGLGVNRADQDTLKAIFDAIDEHSGGILNVPRYLDVLGESDEGRAQVLGTLADGILVLSREDLHGGYENLPEDIRTALGSGSWAKGGDATKGWGADIEPLASILEHADGDLMGGKDFSALLTAVVGANASPEFLHPEGKEFFERNAQILLDVSTRNNEANHAILTDSFYHPDHRNDEAHKEDYKIDAAGVVQGIFVYDWPEPAPGERTPAAGLIAWIPELAHQGGLPTDDLSAEDMAARQMAGEAAAGLINLLGSDALFQELTDTGVPVHDEATGTTRRDLTFTQYNPALADALADVFESYVGSFALEYGFPAGYGDGGSSTIDLHWRLEDGESPYNPADGTIKLGVTERLRFLQYLAANEDSAVRMVSISGTYQELMLGGHLATGNGITHGTRAATLQGLVDAAFNNEQAEREADLGQEQENRKATAEKFLSASKDATALLPTNWLPYLAGQVVENVGKEIVNQAYNNYIDEAPNWSNYTSPATVQKRVDLEILGRMVEAGKDPFTNARDVDGQSVESILREAGILTGTGEEMHVRTDGSLMNGPGGTRPVVISQAIRNAIDSQDVDWIGGRPMNGRDFSDEYVSPYATRYDDIRAQLFYDRADYESLENRQNPFGMRTDEDR